MVPLDPYALEQLLRSASSAEVRFSPPPTKDPAATGEEVETVLRAIDAKRREYETAINKTEESTRFILSADHFFDEASRESIGKMIVMMRAWAPKLASRIAPETSPMVLAFPGHFRPYNDALTRLVRAVLDSAGELEARLVDEIEEDAEADAWAARHPHWAEDDGEELVPLSELTS